MMAMNTHSFQKHTVREVEKAEHRNTKYIEKTVNECLSMSIRMQCFGGLLHECAYIC